jgi:hypothetical protein
LRGPSVVAGWLVSRSDPVGGRTPPVGDWGALASVGAGKAAAGTEPVGRFELPENGGAPIGTRLVIGLTVPVVRLTESKNGFTEPLGEVAWPDAGSAPVAGRVAV